ncbi:MAG: hypothetical protein JSW07_23265 [bacterium]|nr:MAG: hypothetical protein JSW07_23265 [bacterium]
MNVENINSQQERLKIDTNVHLIAIGPGINTVYELVQTTKRKGLTHISIVEHGPFKRNQMPVLIGDDAHIAKNIGL